MSIWAALQAAYGQSGPPRRDGWLPLRQEFGEQIELFVGEVARES